MNSELWKLEINKINHEFGAREINNEMKNCLIKLETSDNNEISNIKNEINILKENNNF